MRDDNSCGDGSNVIRKIRKKLRQIQTLERVERELTPEEELKVKHLVVVLKHEMV